MYISAIITALVLTIVIMITSIFSVYATTNDTDDINKPLYRQIQELIINPNFAPDHSCLFDAYQLHCIPGEDQKCPEGFGGNEDGTCFAKTFINGTWDWECPAAYHSEDDDETGQCYPDTEPCWPGQIRYPDFAVCGDEEYVCEKHNLTGCMVNGRSIVNLPNEYCLTGPDNERCAILPGYGCPEGFATMNSANFTIPRCVPESAEEVEKAERERQVLDPNRCAPGHRLQVGETVDIHKRGDNIGNCYPID
jgi:hypothetical protein